MYECVSQCTRVRESMYEGTRVNVRGYEPKMYEPPLPTSERANEAGHWRGRVSESESERESYKQISRSNKLASLACCTGWLSIEVRARDWIALVGCTCTVCATTSTSSLFLCGGKFYSLVVVSFGLATIK